MISQVPARHSSDARSKFWSINDNNTSYYITIRICTELHWTALVTLNTHNNERLITSPAVQGPTFCLTMNVLGEPVLSVSAWYSQPRHFNRNGTSRSQYATYHLGKTNGLFLGYLDEIHLDRLQRRCEEDIPYVLRVPLLLLTPLVDPHSRWLGQMLGYSTKISKKFWQLCQGHTRNFFVLPI